MSRKKRNNYQSNYEVNYKGGYNYDKRVILSKLDKIDNKINKIDDDINLNPFTRLFKVKGKKFFIYLFILILTVAFMILVYLLWTISLYNFQFTKESFVEILGNGFFWLIAGVCYFMINNIFSKLGWC